MGLPKAEASVVPKSLFYLKIQPSKSFKGAAQLFFLITNQNNENPIIPRNFKEPTAIPDIAPPESPFNSSSALQVSHNLSLFSSVWKPAALVTSLNRLKFLKSKIALTIFSSLLFLQEIKVQKSVLPYLLLVGKILVVKWISAVLQVCSNDLFKCFLTCFHSIFHPFSILYPCEYSLLEVHFPSFFTIQAYPF